MRHLIPAITHPILILRVPYKHSIVRNFTTTNLSPIHVLSETLRPPHRAVYVPPSPHVSPHSASCGNGSTLGSIHSNQTPPVPRLVPPTPPVRRLSHPGTRLRLQPRNHCWYLRRQWEFRRRRDIGLLGVRVPEGDTLMGGRVRIPKGEQ